MRLCGCPAGSSRAIGFRLPVPGTTVKPAGALGPGRAWQPRRILKTALKGGLDRPACRPVQGEMVLRSPAPGRDNFWSGVRDTAKRVRSHLKNHSCCGRLAFAVAALSGPKRSRRDSTTTPPSVLGLPPGHLQTRSASRRKDFWDGFLSHPPKAFCCDRLALIKKQGRLLLP